MKKSTIGTVKRRLTLFLAVTLALGSLGLDSAAAGGIQWPSAQMSEERTASALESENPATEDLEPEASPPEDSEVLDLEEEDLPSEEQPLEESPSEELPEENLSEQENLGSASRGKNRSGNEGGAALLGTQFYVTGIGDHITYLFGEAEPEGSYEAGKEVTATLIPEDGFVILENSLTVTDAEGNPVEFTQEFKENGSLVLKLSAVGQDMEITALAKAKREIRLICQDEQGEPSAHLTGTVSPAILYEGVEVAISVENTGASLWEAEVTAADGEMLEYEMSADSLTFVMRDSDVNVLLYEQASANRGDLDGEDSSIPGDFQGNQSFTKKDNEPDIELSKTARWTDIEDGYAELTITEKDTSDYSNIPVDYIIILDRTVTMSLNYSSFEGGAGDGYNMSNSPCINPNHYYYKGGISLWLKDYSTGCDINSGFWFEDLPGSAEFWKRHYNQNGQNIMPTYANGCYDRLTMAKRGINELVDRIAAQNAKVPAGALKSRVAFWSFAGSYKYYIDEYRDRGLYNYTGLTEDYSAVKKAVNEVQTFSGTYYLESLKEAYHIITARNASDARRKNVYTKVIFISDGECKDQVAESYAMAEQIKALPNTELFTLAIGMTSDSDGAKLLQGLASSNDHAASFWQTLSFDGGTGSAFAQALFRIDNKAGEVKAVNKVITDQIETKYWDPVEVVSASGGTKSVNLNTSTGILRWQVPEGAGTAYSCTVRLKLKDEYRYLLSDTAYPTNRDAAGADASDIEADPAKAGAVMDYIISGGMYHTQSRKAGVITPKLKYGTVRFEGRKNWAVEGSSARSITICLMRTLPYQTAATQVNNVLTNITKNWQYAFDVRRLPDGSAKPLIKYDERGRAVKYEVTERVPDYYLSLDSIVTKGAANADGGVTIDTQLYNEPFKVKAQIRKTDEETGKPLSGAVFTVCAWSERADGYVPYKGTTNTKSRPYETGTMTEAAAAMTLTEGIGGTKGIYTTPFWLYYSTDNLGKFRIIETKAPVGYFGDWKAGSTVSEASTDADKNVYDFLISPDAAENKSTITVSNRQDGSFADRRVLGKFSFSKNDREAKAANAQGDATLEGAVYRLYAAEDIVHQDGTTGVLYRKNEEIRVSLLSSTGGVNTYRWDTGGTDSLVMGSSLKVIVENLEIGNYYLKEEMASEGYLVDPAVYAFEIQYQGEKHDTAEVTNYKVYEQVKKQALSFYKVTGTDKSDKLVPMEGAKFSVYLLSELSDGKYVNMEDSEIPQAIIDDFRNPSTLSYEALKACAPATVYAEPGDEDVIRGRLVKTVRYATGEVYTAQRGSAEGNSNAYLAAELESDAQGIVAIPALPYGRYLVAETTTPKNMLAARPFVIHVQADDKDGTLLGDGQGSTLEDLVLLMDRPVMSLIRIEKVDSESKAVVGKPGASYVIHDTDGAWFEYYTAEMTSAQKKAYKDKYGDLVVQRSQGENLGTRENPFVTKRISSVGEGAGVYIETPDELPGGTYELEEIAAPEGYILQGYEGVIAKNAFWGVGNRTFYETEETGRWEAVPQGRTKFVVSSGEAVYDEEASAFVTLVRQQNAPAIGKIAVYAEGERLVSARQEGSTILSRLADRIQGFFGSVRGWIGLDTPDEAGMTQTELDKYRDYVFEYEMQPIEGASFEVRAAEDIYSPEGGVSAEKLFAQGELVAALTTDANGQAWTGQEDWPETDIARGLPLGKYTVTQTIAGEGFALSTKNAEPREVEIAYAGQEVPVIYRDASYTIPRQQVRMEVEKRDAESDTLLSGAVFGLYAKEDIQNYKGKTVVKAGTLVSLAETSVNDVDQVENALFAPDLPLAEYYVKELRPPYGYTTSQEVVEIDAAYHKDQREVIEIKETLKNMPVKVQINLMDYFTEQELDHAQLTVLDEEGSEFVTQLTAHENNPVIRGLEIGKVYTVKELVSPEGYYYCLYTKDGYVTEKPAAVELSKRYPEDTPADSVTFTVEDQAALQVVSVFNKPIQGELTIQKTGEEAVGSYAGRDENGNILERPVYAVTGLPGAEYVLRAKEDIVYPDGYSGTLFQKGEIILDRYAGLQGTGIFTSYRIEPAKGAGSLEDVSAYLGVKCREEASQEEIEAFYAAHGSNVERQIPSKEEIADNQTSFSGTPVSFVLRTDENGRVKLTGLPLGEYEVIEVKAPEGYYRDKEECIQDLSVTVPEEEAGRPEALIQAEVDFENARQRVPDPERPAQPKPTEVVYHPAIRITKKADKQVYDPGETVTYRIVIQNTGDVNLMKVRVTDSLAGGEIRQIESLAIGEQYAFEYLYRVPKEAEPGSRIDNTVHAVGTPVVPDPGTDGNGLPILVAPSSYEEPEDTDLEKIFVRGANIVVKKQARQRVYAPGDTAVYEIQVINPNVGDLLDVLVKDSLGGVFRKESGREETIRLNSDGSVLVDVLPSNGSITLIYEYQIPEDAAAGTLKNIVTATGMSQESGTLVENEDEELIVIRKPRISILKTVEKKVWNPGETVHYTIQVTNTGNCSLTDVTVKEQQLTEGQFISATKGSFDGCEAVIGKLAVGETVTLIFDYIVPETAEAGSTIYNIVAASGSSEPIPDPALPELPDGTPNYLSGETVADSDEQEIHVREVQAGLSVTKYSVDEGARTRKAGAAFTLYAAEDIKNLHGTVIYREGQELETALSGSDGIAWFGTDVPVGRYLVRETKAPAGHYSSGKEIEFAVDRSRYDDSVELLSFTDYVENAITAVNVKLIDDRTGNELAGASLTVTDPEGNPVRAWITKISGGYTIKGLSVDTEYRITQTVPRDGYLASFTGASVSSGNAVVMEPEGQSVTFTISDVAVGTTGEGRIDKAAVPDMTKLVLECPFVVGQVQVDKDGELLESWTWLKRLGAYVKSLFGYEKRGLEGVAFAVYAAEDIEHPDGVTGLLFHKGDLAAAGVRGALAPARRLTDSQGLAGFAGMYLGSYEIMEEAAAEGFLRDVESQAFTLAYVDGNTSPVTAAEGHIHWTNPRQKVRVEAAKLDKETKEPLSGAVFGLYAAEDIRNYRGEVIVPADTLLELAGTDGSGQAVFLTDLPLAAYYVLEEEAPEGYRKEENRQEFAVRYEKEKDMICVELVMENQPEDVEITVEKSAPEKVREKEVFPYTIRKVRNEGNCRVDNFTLTDILPGQAALLELYTGTFEGLWETDSYSVWYQTNQNPRYRLWKSEIPADQFTRLLVTELKLSEGEEITSFQYRFGTVEKGFHEVAKPVYSVRVKEHLAAAEKLENVLRLQGDKLGTAYTAEDKTVTCLYYPETGSASDSSSQGSLVMAASPVTGDGAKLWFYLWILAAAAAAILWLLLRRKKA